MSLTDSGFRANIQKVDPSAERPFWSVVIPTYNCADYLEESLGSVLQQAMEPGQMEIIVVDDCSTEDDPSAVIDRVDDARVRFIRQTQNVGKAKNYATGINAARGRWIHVLHGDDRVTQGFYASMANVIAAFQDAGAVFCESHYIDASGQVTGRTGKERSESGLLDNWLERIFVQQRIQTPSIVVRRDVYEELGGFDSRLNLTEDWEMWIRVATCYSFAFNTEAIAEYRTYAGNSSSNAAVSGAFIADLRALQSIVDQDLPPEIVKKCCRDRGVAIAYGLIQTIPAVRRTGSLKAWLRLFAEVMSYSIRPRVIYYFLLFSVKPTM